MVLPLVRITRAYEQIGVPTATLRWLWFNSHPRLGADGRTRPGNAFGPAFLKIGAAVYVDPAKFLEIARAQNGHHNGTFE